MTQSIHHIGLVKELDTAGEDGLWLDDPSARVSNVFCSCLSAGFGDGGIAGHAYFLWKLVVEDGGYGKVLLPVVSWTGVAGVDVPVKMESVKTLSLLLDLVHSYPVRTFTFGAKKVKPTVVVLSATESSNFCERLVMALCVPLFPFLAAATILNAAKVNTSTDVGTTQNTVYGYNHSVAVAALPKYRFTYTQAPFMAANTLLVWLPSQDSKLGKIHTLSSKSSSSPAF
ncbi:hypothetical protein Tco_0459459 [Tanacetum coccineum]